MKLAKYEVKEKTIGNYTFYVRAFPPLYALELLGDLQAVITASLKGATANTDKNSSILDAEVNIGNIVSSLGENLKGPVLVKFANRLLDEEYISVKLKNDNGEYETVRLNESLVNEVFGARISDMLKLLYFVIEVNYSDFFDLIPDVSGLQKMLVKK